LDLKDKARKIYRGDGGKGSKVDCTLIIDDQHITELLINKLDPLEAYMTGKLKVLGNITAIHKLQQLWLENSNRTQSASPTENEDHDLLESIPVSGLKSDIVFSVLRNRMHEEPEFVRRITAAYQFNVTSNGELRAIWSAENKTNALGAVYNEPYKNGKPDCSITVEDDDLAFMLGKLKVKGNIMLLQRLNSLWIELQKSGKAPEIPFIVDLISKTNLLPGLRSEMMIIELIQRLIRLPYLCQEILKVLIGFEITQNHQIVAEYCKLRLDFSKSKLTGVFDRGLPPDSADNCILTMSDDDFVRLVYHRFTLEKRNLLFYITKGIEMKKIKARGRTDIIEKITIIFKTPTSRVKL
ncbi:SCP-2-like protein, partial [Sarcoptes scabiei]